jgi:cysteine synthase A
MQIPFPQGMINQYLGNPVRPPLVPVQLEPTDPVIWCKLEFMNPSGSTKDRMAGFILTKALRRKEIIPGGTVVEASSGSTSIAMAFACAQLGLKFLAVMPESVSRERALIVEAYGGDVLYASAAEGLAGALALADREAESHGYFVPRQFENPDNPASHRYQTAQEIMTQLPSGVVDAVVSGVGTGGTLVGLYLGFSDFGCTPIPVATRPITGRAVPESECCSFSSRIPGVAEGLSKIYREAHLPGLLELEVDDDQALDTTRRLIRRGFPVGPSSGLNFQAALQVAKQLDSQAQIVTVFPDRMERYFSTELFQ